MFRQILPVRRQLIVLCTAITCLSSGVLYAEDRVVPDPESQIAESIANHYRYLRMGDEVVELNDGTTDFFAIYQQSRTANPQGGLLFIHDQSQTMDWPIILQEVRTYLPDTGWDTLAIAMPKRSDRKIASRTNPPVPEEFIWKADSKNLVYSRINAGLSEFNKRGLLNIVLIGYGTGSSWAANYMSTQLTDIKNVGFSLILIDSKPAENDPPIDLPSDLATLTIPILDVHFSQTKFEVQQAKLRKGAALRAQVRNYTQVKEAKLNSEFANPPGRVTRRIWGWLKQNAAGTEATVKTTN